MMTEATFFRKLAKWRGKFKLVNGTMLRMPDGTCPVVAVRNVEDELVSPDDYESAADLMGLDRSLASDIAEAADCEVCANDTENIRRLRKRLLRTLGMKGARP